MDFVPARLGAYIAEKRRALDAVGVALLVVAFGATAQSDFSAAVAALATVVALRQQ